MNNKIVSDSAGSQLNRLCPIEDANPFQIRLEKHKPAARMEIWKGAQHSAQGSRNPSVWAVGEQQHLGLHLISYMISCIFSYIMNKCQLSSFTLLWNRDQNMVISSFARKVYQQQVVNNYVSLCILRWTCAGICGQGTCSICAAWRPGGFKQCWRWCRGWWCSDWIS